VWLFLECTGYAGLVDFELRVGGGAQAQVGRAQSRSGSGEVAFEEAPLIYAGTSAAVDGSELQSCSPT
jgi:hypothetical protein